MSTVKELTDVDLILEIWTEYASAVMAGDLERWLALWIPEGKQMPPNAPARLGLDQIREGNEPLITLFDTEMAIHPDEVRILGDHAFSHGNYEYAITPKEGRETLAAEGKFLTILVRQANGSWKIAIDCFNDNAPPNS